MAKRKPTNPVNGPEKADLRPDKAPAPVAGGVGSGAGAVSGMSRAEQDVVARAYRKVMAKETLTSQEQAAIKRHEKEKEERLLNLAYSSLRKRVAKALVDIVGKFNLKEQMNPIEISREDIAQYVGTATESLIRTLSDFKAEKLIDIKSGKIIVNNVEKLKNLLY